MHKIIESFVREFSDHYGFSSSKRSKQFEEFATYCATLDYVSQMRELTSLTTDEMENGIDGLAVVIDNQLILSKQAAEEVFETPARNHEVRFLCVQAKSGEKFDKGEVLKFLAGVEALFIRGEPADDPHEREVHDVLQVVIANATKVRGGKPSITCSFTGTGKYLAPAEIEREFTLLASKLEEAGVFSTIEVGATDRDGLIRQWEKRNNQIAVKLTLRSSAPLPSTPSIEESYLAVVDASEFVDRLLTDEKGGMRPFVFNENVRAFLGSENPVNTRIQQTLQDGERAEMFPILNNGITVISPDVVVQGSTATLSGFQIINGCQTSNVLFQHREMIPSGMMVNVKLIETSDLPPENGLILSWTNPLIGRPDGRQEHEAETVHGRADHRRAESG